MQKKSNILEALNLLTNDNSSTETFLFKLKIKKINNILKPANNYFTPWLDDCVIMWSGDGMIRWYGDKMIKWRGNFFWPWNFFFVIIKVFLSKTFMPNFFFKCFLQQQKCYKNYLHTKFTWKQIFTKTITKKLACNDNMNKNVSIFQKKILDWPPPILLVGMELAGKGL